MLHGKPVAEKLLASLRAKVEKLDPKMVIVQVGDNVASEAYISQKMKAASSVGMRAEHRRLPADVTLDTLMTEIEALNDDDDVTGFIVQMPLPDHLMEHVPLVVRAIHPDKDIDGFGPWNVGSMFLSPGSEMLAPATALGVVELLDHYEIEIQGKHAVVIGRSNIVGKPLSVLLLNRNATVTICHSKTKDLGNITRQADILCSAVGKPRLITNDMVKPGAVVVDVGFSREEEGILGDVDFANVKDVASAISPVPGGVGPLTVACLIRNCVRAKELQREK